MAKDETASSSDPSRFETLVESLLDGQISVKEEAELVRHLRSTPGLTQVLAEALLSDQALRGVFLTNASDKDSDWVAAIEDAMLMSSLVDEAVELKRIHAIEDQAREMLASQQAQEQSYLRLRRNRQVAGDTDLKRVIVIPKSIVVIGVAAVLALMVWIGWDPAQPPSPPATDPPVVAERAPQIPVTPGAILPPATLRSSHQATWAVGSDQIGEHGAMPVGVYEIESGFLQLHMLNGTDVLVQGPARIAIESDEQVSLFHGVLTAHVTQEVAQFIVDTPAGRITDLGTEFGVIARIDALDNTTDVHVMQGQVKVALAMNGQSQSLDSGHAARLDRAESRVMPIAVQSEQFLRNWESVVYAPSTSGAVKYLYSAPPSLVEGSLESTQNIFLVPERMGVNLSRDIPCEITSPGEYGKVELEASLVNSGISVDSYLLHFDRVGSGNHLFRAEGVVEFDRPILGVILSDGSLVDTDMILGAPDTIYPESLRDAEFQDSKYSGWDIIVLSDDRKTLSVNLTAASNIDQLRILVQAYTE